MLKRTAVSYFALMIIFGLLLVNIFLIDMDVETARSSQTSNTRSITLSSSRGMIYDCNMKKLVNSEGETVTVCLPSTAALNAISPYVTESEKDQIYKNMTDGKVSVIKTVKQFNESDIKSVAITNRYAKNQPCVHLIGHLDDSGSGAAGLEKAYDSFLSSQSGNLNAVWGADAMGRILYGGGIDFKSDGYLSQTGIQLTIDLDIQRIAETALQEHGIDRGAAVVMDADTAELLACASIPEFDPLNLGDSINDDGSPFLNRATAPYSVGSVFKPFVAAASIESNISTTHTCTGSIEIGTVMFSCNDNTAHGYVNLRTAMEKSCNSFFIALGQKVGAEKIISLCSAMGLGKEAELADNFYLKAGNLPSPDEITSPQELANLSFGQGKLLASPIQMAAAYACFANGGLYRPPTLMKAIIDENGEAVQKVRLPESRKVLSRSTVSQVDSVLRSVVTDGNGSRAFSELTDARGKTATAQSGWYENGREISHTWFCGYFHTGGRTLVIVIFKEDGSSGAVDCAPVFKDVSEKITEIQMF